MIAMKRTLGPFVAGPHGKLLMGGEPLVFHCNYYNYFLQKTLPLDEELAMHEVMPTPLRRRPTPRYPTRRARSSSRRPRSVVGSRSTPSRSWGSGSSISRR